jgi:hypothetical protein
MDDTRTVKGTQDVFGVRRYARPGFSVTSYWSVRCRRQPRGERGGSIPAVLELELR